MPNKKKSPYVTLKVYIPTGALIDKLLKDYKKKGELVGREGRSKMVHIMALEKCRERGLL